MCRLKISGVLIGLLTWLFVDANLNKCNLSISEKEYAGLVSLYDDTNGTYWKWRTNTIKSGSVWNISTDTDDNLNYLSDPCSQNWQGLSCLYRSTNECYISEVVLEDYGLDGQLPSQIGYFANATIINFSYNKLRGTIPSSIGNLSNLEILILDSNSFSSTIPLSIGCLIHVVNFSIYDNDLSGMLPASLGAMKSLEILQLSTNSLSGPIPSTVGGLKNLKMFEACENFFTSTVPGSMWSLQYLDSLIIYTNFLTGTLSASLGNLSSLVQFAVFSNYFSGRVPSSLGSLQSLNLLYMNENILTGTIPESLGQLENLTALYLYVNSLTGSLPSSIGNLTSVVDIILYSNSLSGTISQSIFVSSQLELLYLAENLFTGVLWVSSTIFSLDQFEVNDNFLTGSLQSELGSITTLSILYLYGNYLTNVLPITFAQLVLMQSMLLQDNLMSGSLPDSIFSQMNFLREFSAAENSISGTIPSSFGKALEFIDLSSNALTGSFPSYFGDLDLLLLFLNGNQLDGNLQSAFSATGQFSRLKTIDIANNAFSGSVPAALFSLPALVTLSATSNCFHGSLTAQLTDSSMSVLQTIEMDGLSSGSSCREYLISLPGVFNDPGYFVNFMTGSIPSVLWGLPQLSTVSFVGNGFTGSLNVGSFDPENSKLSQVNLAYNRLVGSVPMAWQTFGKFEFLDLAYNRFSGTLNDMFAWNSSFLNNINISVNRLSGAFPSQQNSIVAQSTDIVHNILLGNLFSFDLNSIQTANPGETAIYNGSTELNTAMYAAAIGLAIWFCFAIPLYLQSYLPLNPLSRAGRVAHSWYGSDETDMTKESSHQRATGYVAILKRFVVDVATWLNWRNAGSIECRRLFHVVKVAWYGVAFSLVTAACLACGFAVIKISPAFQAQLATYQVQYCWTVSVAYLHGIPPVVLCVCAVFTVSLYLSKQLAGPIQQTTPAPTVAAYAEQATEVAAWTRVKVVLLLFLDVAFMLTMNGLYLSVVLDNNPKLTLIQLLLASYKLVWSKAFPWWSSRIVLPELDQDRDHVFQICMHLFNFVIAPCIATALSDPACFYQLLYQPSASSGFTDDFCVVHERGITIDECVEYGGEITLAQPFSPPFVYSYQCGSALIVNYVPVLLYVFLLSAVVIPAGICACFALYDSLQHRISPSARNLFFPLIFFIDFDADAAMARGTLGGGAAARAMLPSAAAAAAGGASATAYSNKINRIESIDFGLRSISRSVSDVELTESIMKASFIVEGEQGGPEACGFDYPRGDHGQGKEWSSSGSLEAELSRSVYTKAMRVRVFNGAGMMNRLMLHVVIMLTFGLAAPFLALIVGCSFLSEIVIAQLLVGRYLYFHSVAAVAAATAADSAAAVGGGGGGGGGGAGKGFDRGVESDLGVLQGSNVVVRIGTGSINGTDQLEEDPDTARFEAACEVIDRALVGVWCCPFLSMRFIVVVAIMFWALLCFDMVGDEAGYESGLAAMLGITACLPLAVYVGTGLTRLVA